MYIYTYIYTHRQRVGCQIVRASGPVAESVEYLWDGLGISRMLFCFQDGPPRRPLRHGMVLTMTALQTIDESARPVSGGGVIGRLGL